MCFASVAQKSSKFQYSLIQSFGATKDVSNIFPFGIDFDQQYQVKPESPLYFGFGVMYQNYGSYEIQDVSNSHNIYQIRFSLSFRLLKSKVFQLFSKNSIGVNWLFTRSFEGDNAVAHIAYALFADEEDEYVLEPINTLLKRSSFSPSLSTGLSLELDLKKSNFVFLEFGYTTLGLSRFIKEDMVSFSSEGITYQNQILNVAFVNLKLGLIHYF